MRELIARLTGHQSLVKPSLVDQTDQRTFWTKHRIGVSQLNEILLALAYETVSEDFFVWCFGNERLKVKGVDRGTFQRGIEKFEMVALLKYGNVKFGFKTLGKMSRKELEEELQDQKKIQTSVYMSRPAPLLSIQPIKPSETYLIGHLTGEKVEQGSDVARKKRLHAVRKIGLANLNAYLCSDEMDVYVATSMRDVEDFYFVGMATKRLFTKPSLAKLKLRYFDPTQAFCEDRIEKGLVESLMLRRAKCTVYCAQTSETLGKDSELAITLAQGKPVVVYVPKIKHSGNEARYRKLCREAARIHAAVFNCSEEEYYRTKLIERHSIERHSYKLRYDISTIKSWNRQQLENRLVELDHEQFETRAALLSGKHPLGIQVNLNSGVANGVLIVRTLTECAQVLREIVTNTLLLRTERDANGTLRLVEQRTGCIYRLMVSNPVLTNSFWDFYKPWIVRG